MDENVTNHSKYCVIAFTLHDRLKSAYSLMWRNFCTSCNGLGGSIYYFDPSPGGISLGAGWMEDFEPCPDCIEQGLCPRCGEQCDSSDLLDNMHECPHCGWDSEQADTDSRRTVFTQDTIADLCNNVADLHAIPPNPECYCYENTDDTVLPTHEQIDRILEDYDIE